MTAQEFENAKALWKFFYAHECFRQVENACSFIIANSLTYGHPACYPLMSAICVLCAKPFSHSNVVGKLTTDIVPAEFGELHQSIVDQRNQLYAHTDGNAFALNGFEPANQVRLSVSETEARLIAPLFRLQLPLIPKVLKLCELLQEGANQHIESLQESHHREFLEPGEYAINIFDRTGSFWIRKPRLTSLESET